MRVQRELLAHAGRELSAVGSLAHGRGQHGEIGLAAVAVDLAAIVCERAKDPLDRLLRERAVCVHAVAQPRDL